MNGKQSHIKILLSAICIAGLLLGSCRSSTIAYEPTEVKRLSREIGFPVSNTDENIPLYAEASLWLHTPYRYGGLSKQGIDCSGLVYCIYRNVYRKTVSRATAGLEKETKKVSKGSLRAGDLVFFATGSNKKKISHVGIFLKDGYFVHASSSGGVIVSHLNENYYIRTWKRGGRF